MAGLDTVQGFLDRIDRQDGCWRWPGTWHAGGYPLVKFQGRQWPVHRLAYNLLVGPLDPGQQLTKACEGLGCVRPGDGHWQLARRETTRAAGSLPRGISYQGVDRHGEDIWQVSVYLGRDQRRKPVEQRVRVHGTLEQATRRRDDLLAKREEERRKLANGVYRKTMAELLDKYFTVWQRTPRKGHLPARITAYHRHRLIEKVLKPAFGDRIPAQVLPGQIADWYDELMQFGYTTQVTTTVLVAAGGCPTCG
jgi:hypothetical protein